LGQLHIELIEKKQILNDALDTCGHTARGTPISNKLCAYK
jgi:hypothetical protein